MVVLCGQVPVLVRDSSGKKPKHPCQCCIQSAVCVLCPWNQTFRDASLPVTEPVGPFAQPKKPQSQLLPIKGLGHSVTCLTNCAMRTHGITEHAGDCWAFAVTEGVETINAIAGNGYQTLSPQQVQLTGTLTVLLELIVLDRLSSQ